jgi:citrate synthase
VGSPAHREETLKDSEQKIARPRQIYTGLEQRDFVPIELRGARQTAQV